MEKCTVCQVDITDDDDYARDHYHELHCEKCAEELVDCVSCGHLFNGADLNYEHDDEIEGGQCWHCER